MAEILDLGISTTFNYDISFESMMKLIKEAGFSAISLGGGNVEHSGYHMREGRKMIQRVLSGSEILLDSIHAPFGKERDISHPDPKISTAGCDGIGNTLVACRELGAGVAILHLNSKFPEMEYEKRYSTVIKSLEELITFADRLGAKLAVENLPHPNSMRLFNEILDYYSELKVCYDSSHAYINGAYFSGKPFKILDKYFNRIAAVHLSDGARHVDDHLLLYQGKIEWKDFVTHFSKTSYKGTLLLEVEMKATGYKDPAAFLNKAYEGAVRLFKSIKEGGV